MATITRTAVLDEAHIGDIRGALGTISADDFAPRAGLSVEVSPEKPVYAPGELARLQVRTRVDGKDGPAAVGLFGVDETLAQLAPLPGAGALDSVRPAPSMASSAFGT